MYRPSKNRPCFLFGGLQATTHSVRKSMGQRKRKRRKESQSTVHIFKMEQNLKIFSHTMQRKKRTEKREQLATAVRQEICEVRPDLIKEELCYEYAQINNSGRLKFHLQNMVNMREEKHYCSSWGLSATSADDFFHC